MRHPARSDVDRRLPHHDGSPLHVSHRRPRSARSCACGCGCPTARRRHRAAHVGRHPVEPRTASRGSTRRRSSPRARRLAVVAGRRRGREPGARLPLAARGRRRPPALAEPARALDDRGARPRRLPARRARAGARVGGVERAVPGVPRPVRAVGGRGRPRDARLGDPGRAGTTRSISNRPARSAQFYGGDLDGVREHLDHLESLGVNLLYLTPVFPARSNHRYDASTFDHVDPLLGGDEALVAARRGGSRARHPGHRRPHVEPLGRRARVVPRGAGRPRGARASVLLLRRDDGIATSRGSACRACRSSTGARPNCAAGSSRAPTRSWREYLEAAVLARRLAHRRRQHDRPARRRTTSTLEVRQHDPPHDARRQPRHDPARRVDERRGSRLPGRRVARRDDVHAVHPAAVELAARAGQPRRRRHRVRAGGTVPTYTGVDFHAAHTRFAAGFPWRTRLAHHERTRHPRHPALRARMPGRAPCRSRSGSR